MNSHQSLFIGITSDEDSTTSHLKSAVSLSSMVKKAKGVPLLLSSYISKLHLENLVSQLSGLIVAGGAFDIPPFYYGEKKKYRIDPPQKQRTDFELHLISEAIAQDKPLLGICGGMQAINVAMGGNLYQDIRAEIPCAGEHEQKNERSKPGHYINVLKGTRLSTIVKSKKIGVNSTHHQAVKELGKNLSISAFAEDGVVEAIESEKYRFLLGVQWHPEVLKSQTSLKIFRAFIESCSKK